MPAGRIQREPLQLWLFVDHDEVHIIARAKTMIGDGEQGVRIGREVDPGDRSALREHHVDQARSLVTEPVVIVAPARRREQDVE